jgi:protein arginine kinase
MSAAVMLHLPALDATGDSARFSDSMERDWKNIELRKFPPDDGDSLGSFYILSNRKTLGVSEGEIAAVVSDASRSLVSKELFARHRIKNMREGDINDRFWRTWGLLRHAKKLTYPEAMEALSFVKLGADIGVLPHIDNRDWRRILNGAQRNHMRMGSPVIIDESKEPFARAAMFRQFIESRSSSVR